MTPTRVTAIFFLPIAFSIAGCNASPNFDSRFGYAVNTAKAQQTLNPNASLNTDPVVGLDGTPAKDSIGRYQQTFKEPPPTFEIFFGGQGLQSR